MEDLKERLKDHEGFVASPRRGPAGYWNIGHGHYLGNGQAWKISLQIADMILEKDIHRASFEYISLGLNLDEVRSGVIIEMIFWHGLNGFLKFKKCIAALEKQDWQKAADEMLDSNSGRDYRSRMTTLACLMIEGG